MVDARQQLADDVGRLEQAVRDAEREALKSNRDAAVKLRDSLNNLDESDVQTRLQRSADLMRQGENPAGDSSEDDIPDALAKLGESVRQAGHAGSGAGSDEALSAVQRSAPVWRRWATPASGPATDLTVRDNKAQARGAKGAMAQVKVEGPMVKGRMGQVRARCAGAA